MEDDSKTTTTPAQDVLKETADIAEAEGKPAAAGILREAAEDKPIPTTPEPLTPTPKEPITAPQVLKETAEQAQAEGKPQKTVDVLNEAAAQIPTPKPENKTIESLVTEEEKPPEGKILSENHVEEKQSLGEKFKSLLPFGKKKPPPEPSKA